MTPDATEDDSKPKADKGETADSMSSIVLFPALNALLMPASKTLGSELDARLKQWLDRKKDEKRADNIKQNLQKVQMHLEEDADRPVSNITQMELFTDWVDGVKDVDPGDEIAKAWQHLLASAIKGNADQDVLLASLKKLSASDAKYFVTTFRTRDSLVLRRRASDRDAHFLATLVEARIAERVHSAKTIALALSVPTLLFGVITAFFVGIVLKGGLLTFIPRVSSQAGESLVSNSLLPILALAAGASYFYFRFVLNSVTEWRLTWIGKALIKYVKD